MQHIEYRNNITRQMLKDEPEVLFVFGDNMQRWGKGGQAYHMRGEPNSVGIPTKRTPKGGLSAFFIDDDYFSWLKESEKDILRLKQHTGKIVWPLYGIDTGRARLKQSSLRIYEAIKQLEEELQ